MSTYAELAQRRASGELRRTTRVPLCLDPDAISDWQAAQEALAQARRQAGSSLAGGDPVTAESDEEIARTAVQEATILVEYRSLSPETLYRITQETDLEGPAAALYRARLREAYHAAYPWGGGDQPIEDITPDLFGQLVDAMGFGELNTHHAAVEKISTEAVDFPTSRRP